jgi:hypothetical protein
MLPTDRSFEMGLPEPPYWSETAASGGLRLALRHIAAGLARKASIQIGDMAPAPLEAPAFAETTKKTCGRLPFG